MNHDLSKMDDELLEAKLVIFKLLDQFMYITTDNGKEYLDNFCEYAGERAFMNLGIKSDRIPRAEFYKLYDEYRAESMKRVSEEIPIASFLEIYLEELRERGPKDNVIIKMNFSKHDIELLKQKNIGDDVDSIEDLMWELFYNCVEGDNTDEE